MKPYFQTPQVTLYQGDCLKVLKQLPDGLVDCVITSPPYYQKFNYGHLDQLGLEASIDGYCDAIAIVFEEVCRVSKPGSTLFLNIADTWSNYSPVRSHSRERKEKVFLGQQNRRKPDPGFAEKEGLNIPSKVLEAVRRVGWVYDSKIYWYKAIGAKTDERPTQSVEEVLRFFKSSGKRRTSPLYWDSSYLPSSLVSAVADCSADHPATFPRSLVTPLLLSSCPKDGVVLDPFAGSGTTLEVAKDLERCALGIELNPDYCKLIEKRCRQLTIFGIEAG